MSWPTPLTLAWINAAPLVDTRAALAGLYEHSPWIADAALTQRPFVSLAQFKRALFEVVARATREQQLSLVRAHPELAGKALIAQSLTMESTSEQDSAGLTHCTSEQFATLQRLNTDYNAKFDWPFILAVRGPRGTGLTRDEIIATFRRRLQGPADFEFAECLRQIHRIAELRLNAKLALEPELGNRVWDWAQTLAQYSDDPAALTVTYLTDAHRACAQQLLVWMNAAGFDEAGIDAVGNVVGVYRGVQANAPRLLTGSHYDTVRNGGKYDGRLGILAPIACVRELHRAGRRLPFALEVVGFAEEEGQRYKATFLGSGALVGAFDADWLDQCDADGISMRAAMQAAGLDIDAIANLVRDPAQYLGFVETHIEQGPVLDALGLPLGVVTSINGSRRYYGEVVGMASHAGTTPMASRRDAAAAVAELILYVEKRATMAEHLVGTIGMLQVPEGSINVVPGRCRFSLDIRATSDAVRDAMADDVRAHLQQICARRGVSSSLEQSLSAAAAPSSPAWQTRWELAVQALGLPLHRMPSGAGHDAMKLHEILPQAMLFLRGGNAGISHNPLETISSDDAQLCVEAFQHLLANLAKEFS